MDALERYEVEVKENERFVKEMKVKMDAIQKELDDQKAVVEEANQNEGNQVRNNFLL